MSGAGYSTFLERKRRAAAPVGLDVDPGELHPMLHDFQRAGAAWAIGTGRAALFWDCGMGKTFAQLEWARISGRRSLIVAPLSVARQTVREARAIDLDVHYVRDGSAVDGDGIWATNYELIDRFDPADFDAVVLDESSILKSIDGKLRTRLIQTFAAVPRRLACTATPAPNDVSELTNHARNGRQFVGCELKASYWKVARENLDAESGQTRFAVGPSDPGGTNRKDTDDHGGTEERTEAGG